MVNRFWLKLAAIVIAVALFVTVVEAWRADRRDRAQLTAELAPAKQLLVAADARQHDRDAQLTQTLAEFAAEKRAVATPAQIIGGLGKSIPLPAPITLQPDNTSSVGARSSASRAGSRPPEKATQAPPSPSVGAAQAPGSSLPRQAAPASKNADRAAPGGALIPPADLRPLYDFTLDCQACQAKLSVAQNDLADEKAKTSALSTERDDAVRLAKGGSAWPPRHPRRQMVPPRSRRRRRRRESHTVRGKEIRPDNVGDPEPPNARRREAT